MKKLIELFNKKYGHIYGIIDDSIDNEDVFKAYKIIKTLCADDTEIMELLDRVKLPSPKTAKESIDKIDAEHVNGGGGFDENDLIKYNIPFDGREVTEIIYDGDMENYEHVEVEEGVYLVKISDEIIDYKYLEGGSMTVVSNDRTAKLILHLDEVTDEKAYTFTDASVIIVVESIEEIPLGVGVWILQENSDDTHIYPSKIEYYNEGNFNLLDEKYIPYIPGKKLENNAEIFNNMFNVASGLDSHAEGNFTSAYGDASHAEGVRTEATGHYSHAEGYETNATGLDSHAEGDSTIASGSTSHAEGNNTTSLGHNSHAEGDSSNSSSIIQDLSILTPDDSIITAWNSNKFSLAKGNGSHVEGKNSLALGDNSHAEGEHTIASGGGSHAEGYGNTASGDNSHAEGWDTTALGFSSHAEGNYARASGTSSHAEGDGTTASGEASHTEGRYCQSTALTSHAEGDYSEASGYASHAEGNNTHATGNHSHTEGCGTTASGETSHAEGMNATASGYCSHAEGIETVSSDEGSHAEGNGTTASGAHSHAEGSETVASGMGSHTEGCFTKASGEYQHVQGKYNIEDTTDTYAHIVGNGLSDTSRSNAHTLDWDGNAWYAGKLTQEGVPTEDKDLNTKKYVDNNMCNKNNINNFYKEPMELFNINLVTDENGQIVNTSDFDYTKLSTNGYGVGAYKNLPMTEEYEKYLTNIKNLIDVRLKSNDEVIYERLNSSAGGTLPVNIYYPASRDLPCIQFQVRTNYTYDTVNNKYIISNGNMCVFIGIIRDEATQDSYVSTTINATVNLKETNSENISSFVTLKESEQGYGLVPTNHSSDIYTGKYTMNLNSKSAPSYSYVVGSNTFGDTQGEIECSRNLSVFGGNDIFMISYGAIYGIQNSIKAHRSGAGMWGVSVFGNNITFNEAKANKASYLLMCGDHLTATKSGAYIGRYATIPDTEIFAVCNGTSSEEKILLSVNRDTGAVTSISTPTEDTHLTTKKYVDDIDTAVREYVDNKTASIDTTINNTLPSNGALNLTTSKFQTTTLATDTEVILPTVEGYTEIHLFFLGISGTNILDTNVAWNNKPTIEDNKKYEFIYTYVNSEIGWLGKAVVYTV